MNCEQCSNPIEQDRLNWARDKGYQVKYCKDCSQKRKQQAYGSVNPNNPRPDFTPPSAPDERAKQAWIAYQAFAKSWIESGKCQDPAEADSFAFQQLQLGRESVKRYLQS